MAHFSTSIETSLPPGEAFAWLADVRRFPEWDPGTKTVRQVAGDGPGVGARYELDTGKAKLTYETEEFDADVRFRLRGRNAMVTSIDTVTVTPKADGSVITYDAELVPNGLFKLFGLVFDRIFAKLGDEAAEGLARWLPDGRRLS